MTQFVRANLIAAEWKSSQGHAIQIGITDHIEELNWIANWIAENRHQDVYAVDPVLLHRSSIFSDTSLGVKGHFRAPPSVNSHVKIVPEVPDFGLPILFLNLGTENMEPVRPAFGLLYRRAVISGSLDGCRKLLEEAQLTAQPLYACGRQVSIRLDA